MRNGEQRRKRFFRPAVLLANLIIILLQGFSGSAAALENEPFFQDSFLNMGEDAKLAAESGKILMLFFEQEGCPYCNELHKKTLTDAKVQKYLKQHFHAVLVDIYGARETVGFDGKPTREKAFSRQQGVHFTPTIVYYDSLGKELFRLTGYWKPFHFLASMEYVRKGLQKTMNFQDYIHQKARSSSEKI